MLIQSHSQKFTKGDKTMSLASLKHKIEVGTKLKLVRHDWLKPLVVNGNLGQSVMKPNLAIGDVRMVIVKQGNAIAMKSLSPLLRVTLRTIIDYWLYWPEAKSVRETENGFEVDLEDTGKFKYAMGYEFVA
jgi:hypothetical protein